MANYKQFKLEQEATLNRDASAVIEKLKEMGMTSESEYDAALAQASALAMEGEKRKAEKKLRKLIKMDPEHPMAYYALQREECSLGN